MLLIIFTTIGLFFSRWDMGDLISRFLYKFIRISNAFPRSKINAVLLGKNFNLWVLCQ